MLCRIRANLSMHLVAIGSMELEKLIVVWLKLGEDFDFAKNDVTKSVAGDANMTVEKMINSYLNHLDKIRINE